MTDFKIPNKWIAYDPDRYVFKGAFCDWLIYKNRCKRTRLSRKNGEIWIDLFDDSDALEFIKRWMDKDDI